MSLLQLIFIKFVDRFIAKHENLPLYIKKTLYKICICRTPRAGRHDIFCPSCGFKIVGYNSCGNRNCPICQNLAAKKWVEARLATLPKVPYFHLTFTIPHELNPFFMSDLRTDLYNLLFSSSAATITELCADPKYLGAKVGMISSLHTWGQNLSSHPHIHMIATGAGITPTNECIQVENPEFFLPAFVVSKLFRGKFMDGFKNLVPTADSALLDTLYKKDWVVHIKPCTTDTSFGNGEHLSNLLFDMKEHTYTMDITDPKILNDRRSTRKPPERPFESDPTAALEYVAKGMFNSAITEDRITGFTDEKVSFKWIDYSDHNKIKEMTLGWEDFMSRFVAHILPPLFKRTRYYGIFAPKAAAKYLPLFRELTNTPERKCPSTEDLLRETIGVNFDVCPKCGSKLVAILGNYSAISDSVRADLKRDDMRMKARQICYSKRHSGRWTTYPSSA